MENSFQLNNAFVDIKECGHWSAGVKIPASPVIGRVDSGHFSDTSASVKTSKSKQINGHGINRRESVWPITQLQMSTQYLFFSI